MINCQFPEMDCHKSFFINGQISFYRYRVIVVTLIVTLPGLKTKQDAVNVLPGRESEQLIRPYEPTPAPKQKRQLESDLPTVICSEYY